METLILGNLRTDDFQTLAEAAQRGLDAFPWHNANAALIYPLALGDRKKVVALASSHIISKDVEPAHLVQ